MNPVLTALLTDLFLYLCHFSISYLLIIVALETSVPPTNVFFFIQMDLCENIHYTKLLVWFKVFWSLKHYKYWTNTETCVGYAAIAQNQGDHVVRQGVWRQVPGEL